MLQIGLICIARLAVTEGKAVVQIGSARPDIGADYFSAGNNEDRRQCRPCPAEYLLAGFAGLLRQLYFVVIMVLSRRRHSSVGGLGGRGTGGGVAMLTIAAGGHGLAGAAG